MGRCSRRPGPSISLYLSGGNGQVLRRVVGPVVAAGLLVLTAVSFERAEYVRLPLEEEDPSAASSSSQSSALISAGGGGSVFNAGN